MKDKQKEFRDCRENKPVRMFKHAEYKKAMHAFDKLLRKKKRSHEQETIAKIGLTQGNSGG